MGHPAEPARFDLALAKSLALAKFSAPSRKVVPHQSRPPMKVRYPTVYAAPPLAPCNQKLYLKSQVHHCPQMSQKWKEVHSRNNQQRWQEPKSFPKWQVRPKRSKQDRAPIKCSDPKVLLRDLTLQKSAKSWGCKSAVCLARAISPSSRRSKLTVSKQSTKDALGHQSCTTKSLAKIQQRTQKVRCRFLCATESTVTRQNRSKVATSVACMPAPSVRQSRSETGESERKWQ